MLELLHWPTVVPIRMPCRAAMGEVEARVWKACPHCKAGHLRVSYDLERAAKHRFGRDLIIRLPLQIAGYPSECPHVNPR